MNRAVRTTSLIFIGILITAFLVISCRTESTPVIGISASKHASAGGNYVTAVRKAGGIPIIGILSILQLMVSKADVSIPRQIMNVVLTTLFMTYEFIGLQM